MINPLRNIKFKIGSISNKMVLNIIYIILIQLYMKITIN